VAPGLGFVAYPNPLAGRQLHLRLDGKAGERLDLQLLDLQRRVLFREERGLFSGEKEISFQLPALARGTYLLRLQVGAQLGSQWLEVE